ncbi:uncharacterized protein LOC133837695 [Drosophila sulfurigaster albostrigata]|uniref:uncharacterized protein LOC133837695 n=1 Tax=Drosophila sulfurigaster albostrigata TaxID=89887 RepID=UPI002D21AF50|nr:uncharacterized protein LOC133837695 [Drosophila sulfurigaster albostrigata]
MNNINASSYEHKKFTLLKRKRDQDEDGESDDVIFVSELPAKRRFFRPWVDEPQATSPEQPAQKTAPTTVATTYHANMVRSQRPCVRSPKAQQRRDRNTLACLLSRRARMVKEVAMDQQYKQFKQQHEMNMEQQIRLSLYYVRALQQAMASSQAPFSFNYRDQVQHCGQPEHQQTHITKRSH